MFDQLTLNTIVETEANTPDGKKLVAAIYVETNFNMKDTGGLNVIPGLRQELKEKAIANFSSFIHK
mgnify:FL=1